MVSPAAMMIWGIVMAALLALALPVFAGSDLAKFAVICLFLLSLRSIAWMTALLRNRREGGT